ncbi:MAG: DUF1080 domain-containing protein [Verrucomicrobiota bacterium]|jgi:hypothetical protein
MKSTALSAVLLLALATGYGVPAGQMPDAAMTPATKIELFDGRTLSGWTFVSAGTNAPAAEIWSVTNRVILCQGKPNGYARTLKMYRNYQLHVEWRWPSGPGNSGVFLHLNPPDKVWPLCFEAQLLAGSAGEVRLNGGSELSSLTDPTVKSVPRQQPSSEKPAGEWNSYDIVCRGHTITVRVNGVLQNAVSGTSVDAGSIGLQAEGAPVEFRNITLDKLAD